MVEVIVWLFHCGFIYICEPDVTECWLVLGWKLIPDLENSSWKNNLTSGSIL